MKKIKTNHKEVREKYLMVPMTKEEKQEIQKAADNMGLSMSAFVRFTLKRFMRE